MFGRSRVEAALAGVIKQQGELIDKLRKDNDKLLDRVMSLDFKEYKTYQLPENSGPAQGYDMGSDLALAGEILEMKENG